MGALPDGLADSLAQMIDRRDHDAVAEIIEAATMLDDVGLRRFLRMFAQRVRRDRTPIRADELRKLLQRVARGAP